MKEAFTSSQYADFRQRYRDSWGYVIRPDNTKVLVKIIEVSNKKVTFEDKDKTEYFGWADKNLEFEFIPVQRKFVLFNKKAGLFTRHPARQFTRGISETNTSFYATNAQGNLVAQGFDDNVIVNFIENINKLPYNTYQEDFLNGKSPFTTLSDKFLLSKTRVWLLNQEVGEVKLAEKQIKLTIPLIQQELSDALRDTKLPFEVVV